MCVVDHCDDDYIAINQFQCALPPDVSCQPCLADDDCAPGHRCKDNACSPRTPAAPPDPPDALVIPNR